MEKKLLEGKARQGSPTKNKIQEDIPSWNGPGIV